MIAIDYGLSYINNKSDSLNRIDIDEIKVGGGV